MTTGLSFDQAAEYYDKTRSDPPWVQNAIRDSLIRESIATPASRILEIGIGTGRIALPLAEHGLNIFGVDISLRMMEQLRANPRLGSAIRLAQADAASLPFPDNTFDAAYAVHVFHVVGDWKRALSEARRALKAGGRFLISYHYRKDDSANRILRTKLRELAHNYGVDTSRPGVKSTEEMIEALNKWGKPRVVSVAEWTETTTPQAILNEIESRITSDTWAIPDGVMDKIMPDLRSWAQSKFGDLNRPETQYSRFDWMIVSK